MPQAKKIWCQDSVAGTAHYFIVKRQADEYRLDDVTGLFSSAPSDPYVTLTENTTVRWLWEKSESRQIWLNGEYLVAPYRQTGGSPSPVADVLLPPILLTIVSDFTVSTKSINEVIGSISSNVSQLAPDSRLDSITLLLKSISTDLQAARDKLNEIIKKDGPAWR